MSKRFKRVHSSQQKFSFFLAGLIAVVSIAALVILLPVVSLLVQ